MFELLFEKLRRIEEIAKQDIVQAISNLFIENNVKVPKITKVKDGIYVYLHSDSMDVRMPGGGKIFISNREFVEDPQATIAFLKNAHDSLIQAEENRLPDKYKLTEIGFAGLQRKQQTITKLFPSFPDRVKKIASAGGLRLKSTDEEKWTFKVHSGTQDDVWYDIYILFKNIPTTLEKLVMDRRLWVTDRSKVDMSKLAREFLNTADVQISCSCPADLYYGGHYIRSLGKYDAKYSDKELRSPKEKNPRQYGAYCKHLENVMKVLPFYATTASRWLANFYGDEMSEYEEKAKVQFGGVKKAAVALGAKKEEEEQEVKV